MYLDAQIKASDDKPTIGLMLSGELSVAGTVLILRRCL